MSAGESSYRRCSRVLRWKREVGGLVLAVVVCVQVVLSMLNDSHAPAPDATPEQERGATWSSLMLLDPERNSRNIHALLNRTFGDSGFPRQGDASVEWSEWSEDIIFRYPPFTLRPPLFASAADETLFLAHAQNRELLRPDHWGPERRRGVVRVLYGGKARADIACGWDTDLMQFVDTEPVVVGGAGMVGGERNYSAEVIVPILTPDAHSFQHFLDGALPKIVQVLPLLRLPHVRLALPRPRDPVIRRMLARMHLYHRVLWVHGAEVVRSRVQINTCITPPIHPLLWAAMRSELGVSEEFSCSEMSTCKVILLNRALSHNGGRNLKNQRELIHFLTARYGDRFVVYNPQSKLAATKRLFSQARLVVGVHGGALYNVNLAPRQCHVVELMPTRRSGYVTKRLAHTVVWQMASVIGQSYWRVPLPPIDEQDNVLLPIHKFTAILDKVDRAANLVAS